MKPSGDLLDSKFRELQRLSIPAFVHDEGNRVIWANEAYLSLAGATQEEVQGSLYSAVLPRITEAQYNLSVRPPPPGGHRKAEINVLANDQVYVACNRNELVDETDIVFRIQVLHPLITTGENRFPFPYFQGAVDRIDIPVVIADSDKRIIYTNDAFCRLSGKTGSGLRGLSLCDLLSKHVTSTSGVNVDNLTADTPWSGELLLRTHYDSCLPVHLTIESIPESLYTQAGFVCTFLDLGALKQQQETISIQSHALGERIKELRCLHAIAELAIRGSADIEEILEQAVQALEAAYQYPDVTQVRINIKDCERSSRGFEETPWIQRSKIHDENTSYGFIDVCYREERPNADEGPFLQEERALLDDVAAQLAAIIRDLMHVQELKRLATIPKNNPNPLVRIDPDGQISYANPAARRLLGRLKGRAADHLPREWMAGIRIVIERNEAHRFESELLSNHYLVIVSPASKNGECLIYAIDITELKAAEIALEASEQQLHALIRAEANAELVVDGKGVVRFANPATTRLLNRDEDAILGTHLGLPIVAGRNVEVNLVQKDGSSVVAEMRTTNLLWDGEPCHLVTLQDLTARKERERHLQRLNRTQTVLSKCNRTLVRADNETELFKAFCRHIVRLGGYRFAWVGLTHSKPEKTVEPMAWAGVERGYLSQHHFNWNKSKHGLGPVGTAVRTRRASVVRDIATHERFAPWRKAALQRDYRSVIALPLCHDRHVVGIIAIYSQQVDAFDEEEIQLLGELAADLAYGIRSLRTRAAREEAERLLRLRNRAIEESQNGIVITDARKNGTPVVYANSAFEKLTGYSLEEVIGHSPAMLGAENAPRGDLERFRYAIKNGVRDKIELHNRRKDGSDYWCELRISPVHDGRGQLTHFVGVYNDITERKTYEEALEHKANFDDLTGLPNRNLLNDRLTQTLVHARRDQRSAAVLFLDIDQFKLINDALGHSTGDVLLKNVARRLLDWARSGDTVARLSGDEFVIILPDLKHEVDVSLAVERLRKSMSKPMSIANTEVVASLSIGGAIYPRDGESAEVLLKNADAAMYQAKSAGRNAFRFFTAAMNEMIANRLSLGIDLRRAIESDQITLHYQPQVDSTTGQIAGLEALARWQHPEHGMVSPNEFIPLAEELGLIGPLGKRLLQIACRQVVAWKTEGIETVPVAVNLSAKQFRSATLVDDILSMILGSGLTTHDIELEITENAVMQEDNDVLESLHMLREAGMGLALDDFGTGYSSLGQLKGLPFSKIKLDRSFIKHIVQDPQDAAIVRAVIAMGKSLGLTIVAEGVETEGQYEYLRRRHCDHIQGFLLAKPLPPAEVENLMRQPQRKLAPNSTEMSEQPVLLILDDEEHLLNAMQRTLRKEPYQVVTTTSVDEAMDQLARRDVRVVVSDQRMPVAKGTDFLQQVREIHPDVIRIILSGYSDFETLREAVNRGWIYKFLAKPWDDSEFKYQLRDAFLQWERSQHAESDIDT